MSNRNLGFSTLAVHAGAAPDPTTKARALPIYQTTSFVFDTTDHARDLFNLKALGNIYSRLTNPTISALADRITALEKGVGTVITSSGHAAQVTALLPLMNPGCEIVASNLLYGGSINQLTNLIKRFGWSCTCVDGSDPEAFRAAITDKTRAIFTESISNPSGQVTDIAAIAKIANEVKIPYIVDNTLASPYLCRPIEHGAHIVLHSTTKFLSGQGTAIGGSITDSGTFDFKGDARFPSLSEPAPEYHGLCFADALGHMAFTFFGIAIGLRDLGASQSPFNAFLTVQGIETLPLRMQRISDTALIVAKALEKNAGIDWVKYSGLPSSPFHELQQKYAPKGAGGVFTFGVKGGSETACAIANSLELFSLLANVGDVRSLVIHPYSTTHNQLSEEHKVAAGAGPEVIRLSIGLEDPDDLIADLEHSITKVS